MKNRILTVIAACVLCLGLFAACSNSSNSSAASGSAAQGDKIKVVCTIFPAYDWMKEVIGDRADRYEITLLLDNGTDLHSYQPTVQDMALIADCDLFVYVGGESDGWVEDALVQAPGGTVRSINMLEVMGDAAVYEEVVEGMQEEEHDHDHDAEATTEDHDHEAEDHDHEEGELDEHVWLSLRNAQVFVTAFAGELSQIDPDNAAAYSANAEAYNKQLADLDAQYASAVKAAKGKTILFGDRFPFRYLADDYDLDYYAAFVGCSAETEASFETVAFLAQKVDELSLPVVLTIENSDQKIAQTIVQSSQAKDQKILVMDSLQSTSSDDVASGKTYLSAMTSNLDVLVEALG